MDLGSALIGAAWISALLFQLYLKRTGHIVVRREDQEDQAKGLDRIAAWRMAAAALELQDVEESSDRTRLEGKAAQHTVRFFLGGPGVTRITISGTSGITLRPEGLGTALDKKMGATELELRDETFDREVYVRGEPEVLRALLDAETRSVLRSLLKGQILVYRMQTSLKVRVIVLHGAVEASIWENTLLIDELPGIATELLAAARRLVRPPDVAQRLAQNTLHEPEWRIREQNILLLSQRYPAHPATRPALAAACHDHNDTVRLTAAEAIGGAEGRAVLREVASREGAEDACVARAIVALGDDLPPDQALALLSRSLHLRRRATALASIAALGRRPGADGVAVLSKVLRAQGDQLATDAARALGASGEPAAEVPLLAALAHQSDQVRQAAVQALGHVGTAKAVLPLKQAAERHAWLSRLVRQAVAEIQSRLAGATPGQLSLADSQAGRISLADEDPRGRVSMADPKDARPKGSGGE